MQVLLVVAGLALLVGGSHMLVTAATWFARILGVSDLVIGLTIVAVGTSLPEVATSIVAAWKGERDIAVGNVVGSCIFNILGVVGVAGLAAVFAGQGKLPVPAAVSDFDLWVMVGALVACIPVDLPLKNSSSWR